MAKDMDMREHGEGCMCRSCGGTGALWGHHHWGHLLIKVLIVMFIFWAGVQFGELKATVQNSFYGGGMMGGFGRGDLYYAGGQGFGPGMIGGKWGASQDGTTIRMMQVGTSTRY